MFKFFGKNDNTKNILGLTAFHIGMTNLQIVALKYNKAQ